MYFFYMEIFVKTAIYFYYYYLFLKNILISLIYSEIVILNLIENNIKLKFLNSQKKWFLEENRHFQFRAKKLKKNHTVILL